MFSWTHPSLPGTSIFQFQSQHAIKVEQGTVKMANSGYLTRTSMKAFPRIERDEMKPRISASNDGRQHSLAVQ